MALCRGQPPHLHLHSDRFPWHGDGHLPNARVRCLRSLLPRILAQAPHEKHWMRSQFGEVYATTYAHQTAALVPYLP